MEKQHKIADFIRVASVTPAVAVADVAQNLKNCLEMAEKAEKAGAAVVVFPELCLTAYTCGDLFHNSALLEASWQALEDFADRCPSGLSLAAVGLPVEFDGAIYNCVAFVTPGKILALIPKTYLPTYNEFYERRWFAPAFEDLKSYPGPEGDIPFSKYILADVSGVKIGAEICEDMWTSISPSTVAALSGAEIILNLSASNDVIGKSDYLRTLVQMQSARCLGAYVYSSAGYGESTTDLVYNGKNFVCENGRLLAASLIADRKPKMAIADVDVRSLRHDRAHTSSFADCQRRFGREMITVTSRPVSKEMNLPKNLIRRINPTPFVPSDTSRLKERCEEILNMQQSALCKRLEVTGCKTMVVGISGGLDSTLALLVACRAFDDLNLPRTGIVGVTMPGFGTTGRTYRNAITLMKALGITVREIGIAAAVTQHFHDIGHNPEITDVTYENSQARERTQILMDLANELGGMVLGTGDLSELALGWATYNGDHMSMYGVNSGVPKTLVRHLVKYVSLSGEIAGDGAQALADIVDTPISPELVPADSNGQIAQKTEDLVGPYELHDFFIYYMIRFGFPPQRIYYMAQKAFEGRYDATTIKKWLLNFYRRFFAQQFKRSCLPDGPKIGSVTLSPRGDWRMPSDAAANLWISQAQAL